MALFGWLQPAVLFSQPTVFYSHNKSVISHQSANSIFLSQQISTSHQPAERDQLREKNESKIKYILP
jgi:hypothetical protein